MKPATRYAIITTAGLLTALTLAACSSGPEAQATQDPADCSNGTLLRNPTLTPELVADCQTLVNIRNHWGLARLGWQNWPGTTITDNRITDLDLSGNELTGPIPTELSNLTELTILDLSGNQLTGPIPTELSNLTELTILGLYGNQLTGPIPTELGNLTELTGLDLYGNQLTGPIPDELGNLTNFEYLNLGGNQLTGPIPTELGNLTELIGLILHGNQLIGPIPDELGNLTELIGLDLSVNQLTGSIPDELGNLTNLTLLYLYDNQLTGSIPDELGNLNLEELYLHDNDNLIQNLGGQIQEQTRPEPMILQGRGNRYVDLDIVRAGTYEVTLSFEECSDVDVVTLGNHPGPDDIYFYGTTNPENDVVELAVGTYRLEVQGADPDCPWRIDAVWTRN